MNIDQSPEAISTRQTDAPPLVSVLMPVYNCEKYLDESIRSIREQSFTDFEFVIVNDGSTDGSLDVIRAHESQDPRIVVVDQPNEGIVAALNYGLAACRGEFIARMDADDVATPRRFEKQVAYLRQRPEVGVLGGWALLVDEEGRGLRNHEYPGTHQQIDQEGIETGQCGILHPTVMIRSEALSAIGSYSPNYPYAEDADLFLKLAEVTTLANLQEIVLHWRQRPGSICNSKKAEQTRSVVKVVEDTARRRGASYGASVARHAYRASWLASDSGDHRNGLRFAWLSLTRKPMSPLGFRAFIRAVGRALAKVPGRLRDGR